MAAYSSKHIPNANAIYLSCLHGHVTLNEKLISNWSR